jgi:hypothetical protein
VTRRRNLILGLAGTLAAPCLARTRQKPLVVVILDPRAVNPLAVEVIE